VQTYTLIVAVTEFDTKNSRVYQQKLSESHNYFAYRRGQSFSIKASRSVRIHKIRNYLYVTI